MRRLFCLSILVVVCLGIDDVFASGEFWIPTGPEDQFVVGQLNVDFQNNWNVVYAYYYDGEQFTALIEPLPAGPQSPAMPDTEPTGGVSFDLYPLLPWGEPALAVAVDTSGLANTVSPPTGIQEPGESESATGTTRSTNNGGNDNDPLFEPLVALLIQDGFGDWGALLSSTVPDIEDGLQQSDLLHHISPFDYSGLCTLPPPQKGQQSTSYIWDLVLYSFFWDSSGGAVMNVTSESYLGCHIEATLPGEDLPGGKDVRLLNFPNGDSVNVPRPLPVTDPTDDTSP